MLLAVVVLVLVKSALLVIRASNAVAPSVFGCHKTVLDITVFVVISKSVGVERSVLTGISLVLGAAALLGFSMPLAVMLDVLVCAVRVVNAAVFVFVVVTTSTVKAMLFNTVLTEEISEPVAPVKVLEGFLLVCSILVFSDATLFVIVASIVVMILAVLNANVLKLEISPFMVVGTISAVFVIAVLASPELVFDVSESIFVIALIDVEKRILSNTLPMLGNAADMLVVPTVLLLVLSLMKFPIM